MPVSHPASPGVAVDAGGAPAAVELSEEVAVPHPKPPLEDHGHQCHGHHCMGVLASTATAYGMLGNTLASASVSVREKPSAA